jgi:hypothetical protein
VSGCGKWLWSLSTLASKTIRGFFARLMAGQVVARAWTQRPMEDLGWMTMADCIAGRKQTRDEGGQFE